MRLFYIVNIFIFFIGFASFASQKKQVIDSKKGTKLSITSGKKQVKINSDFSQSNENLQKDFINNTVIKISHPACILLTFLSFLFLKNKSTKARTAIKRLKFIYWYLFKILYPKHVFW
ncbi:hypothetical protein ASF92_15150 [Pedobacter sp. Leaf176]|nr:hypothetical protein ASF92_15150 [Pedobacter sp. Leaf176]